MRSRADRRFAVTAVATLALGIGVTSTVFSVVYAVLLRPLPFPESDRLVRLYEEHPGAPRMPGEPPLSNTTMYAWRARLRTLDALAAYYTREYTATIGGEAVRVRGAEASASLFPILRAAAAAGRFYGDEEEAHGRNLVVVISDRFWRERFSRSADAVGRSLLLDGKPHVIVGVASAGLRFPDADTQLWTPYDDPTLSDPSVQGGMWLAPTLARLRPGVSPAQAAAEGTAAARSIARPPVANLLFGSGGPVEVRAERLIDQMTSRIRPALVVLAVSVVFVLLIGCANVANLFLSRGISRQRELAVRAALGASRSQLAGHLLAESARFAGAGGALGLAIAALLLRVIPMLAPRDFPRIEAITIDWTTAAFAVMSSAAAALAAGLAPAWRGTRLDIASALHPGDGGVAGGFGTIRALRIRDLLLVGESAVAALLLIGAALLARSFVALTSVDAGYDAANVLVARVYPAPGTPAADQMRLVADLLDRLRGAPGVAAAGVGNMMPFNDTTWITSFDLPPSAGRGKPSKVRAVRYVITPGYAEALRLRLREGRLLREADGGDGGSLKVLVNEEFVRQYLAAGPAARRRFPGGPYKAGEFEIVGVVGNVLKDGNDSVALPEVYSVASVARPVGDELNVVVRMTGGPAAGAAMLRGAVREIDRGAAVGELMPLAARASAAAAQPRFAMAVLVAFAGLALVLASVGLYGMLSYAVARRRRELGVRAALGANRWDLIVLVAREGVLRAAAGVAIGLAAATLTTELMRSLLFGVAPLDAVAYAAAPLILLPVALVASLGPALRAASSDPAVVLRSE